MRKILRISMFSLICLYFVVNGLNSGPQSAFAEAPVIIKFATLAPEGSTWTNELREIDKELQQKSGGKIRLKIYAGGVQGDEKDVVRKMRIGQTHCAGFTGVGLGEILPEIRIFDLPFFLNTYEEVDHVRNKFRERFAKRFAEKGFVFLGWTEVGFVHFFSNVNVKTLDDLRALKMWMWEGDPLANVLFKSIHLSPIPLAITDVITSLQTGLIDSLYVSPLGLIALQWFEKVKYMLDVPMADATGAILITKKQFNRVPPEWQQMMLDTFRVHTDNLLSIVRRDNGKSEEVLKQTGIEIASMDDKSTEELKNAGKVVREKLAGNLYSKELLDSISAEIEKFRAMEAK